MRKPALSSHLNEHTYPAWLVRHPGWIRIVYCWKMATLQRNWAVRKAMRQLLKKLPAGSKLLDAGCGEGLHLFPLAERHPQLEFTGIDKYASHIAFCEKYASHRSITNASFSLVKLEQYSMPDRFDVVLCIGTLQYIKEDVSVLQNFFHSLRPGGKLVVYVPIHGNTVIPVFKKLIKKMTHYEKSQQRVRIYSEKEILDKVGQAGFSVLSKHYTYGKAGILAHEVYILLLAGTSHLPVLSPLLILLALLLTPVIWLIKVIDYHIPKSTGNGLLIIAE